VLATALLAACDTTGGAEPGPPPPDVATSPLPSRQSGSPAVPESHDGPVTATARTVADGLRSPWGLAVLPDGRLLVSLRDDARLVVVDPATGRKTTVTGRGADELHDQTKPAGEGGLLGVAVAPQTGGRAVVFLYRTGADDNAVVRGMLDLGDKPTLGELTTVVHSIAKAGNHDGGRLAFGPDGYLYVTTGDANDRPNAQSPASLNGKILRVTTDGKPPPDNPIPGSPVWSMGHRNVQGVGWDAAGRMFASEFGQDTWDELNQIVPGGNYGWPQVEGKASGAGSPPPGGGPDVVDGFVQPLVTWSTDEASPSGLAVTGEAVYLAALRGQRLWRVPLLGTTADAQLDQPARLGTPQALLTDQGRLRAVVANPDGTLWVLTNNTDGRGRPRKGDDRLLLITLSPA
jgi:glucose/arabinose dehydrogenase